MKPDWRNVVGGMEIPSIGYCDQPYVVIADDGAWVCIMTTGAGREGQAGQHVVTARSEDRGRTWSDLVPLEPADGPEASYAVLLKVPGGRIYAFYNHNTDNVRAVKADDPPYEGGRCHRVDSLGHFVFKFSDDGGRTWSADRYDIPQRPMAIDRENADGGELLYFWNVGRPFIHADAAYVSLHKVGGFGEGFFTRSEGVLLRSANLPIEADPNKITWETLPDGDAGLRTPSGGGPVAEEQSYAVLSDGSIYSVYRSIDGHPVCAYSRDQGHTWSEPRYQSFDDGRLMKNPRAATFLWKCSNGKYLYWFHNHGGRHIREHPQQRSIAYNDRNPVWLCGGEEVDGPAGREIRWSQPEIVLYDDDPYVRMSYPDLIEQEGSIYLTETQKETARVHEVDGGFLEALWGQFDSWEVTTSELLIELPGNAGMPLEAAAPGWPTFTQRDTSRADHGTQRLRSGITVEVCLRLEDLTPGQWVLDGRSGEGSGIWLEAAPGNTLQIGLNDGRTETRWSCDPGLLTPGSLHHVVAIVDGGAGIISFLVDGLLCDGGDHRQFGWGRLNPHLRDVRGSDRLRIGKQVKSLRIYGRSLLTSEAIGNYRAATRELETGQ
ncbi:MAG: hypothetical protein QGI83_06880 [Candidatus Latescibacteria bacterium]|jgi:hypothetical protein|nr:hypothetical protein [Candidatus Latescibacterota bacterium]